MKRCPKCEFIYEESQHLCDMDGMELVHDPQEIPKTRLPRKRKAVTSILQLLAMALPAVVLSALIFFGSSGQVAESADPDFNAAPAMKQPGVTSNTYSTVKTAGAPVQVIDGPSKKNGNEIGERSVSVPATNPTGANDLKNSTSPAQERLPAKAVSDKSEVRKVKPEHAVRERNWQRTEPPKKDSKISSLLKKTGRIFKKPFQM
jgi:hypothetical protein